MGVSRATGRSLHSLRHGDGCGDTYLADCAVAIVTDNLNYETSYQAFERPPDFNTLYSLIPRGVRRFFLSTGLQAKPLNDKYDVHITATLPENFAYVMRSLNLEFTGDKMADWETVLALRMLNHIPGQALGTTEQLHAELTLYVPALANPALTLGPDLGLQNFTMPTWSTHEGQVTFRVKASNNGTAAAGAAFVVTHCEFYEYDLTQAQRYWLNTPYPVQMR